MYRSRTTAQSVKCAAAFRPRAIGVFFALGLLVACTGEIGGLGLSGGGSGSTGADASSSDTGGGSLGGGSSTGGEAPGSGTTIGGNSNWDGGSSGGAAVGGTSSGGTSSGGSSAGGTSSGGASSGGSSAGGSGGSSSGGSSVGGTSSGGTSSGGSSSGGGSTGGSSSGGSSTGGMGGSDACSQGEIIPCKLDPPPSTGDPYQDCVNRINQFRWECACLPPIQRWTEAESCSDEQCGLDAEGDGAHGNFGMCGEFAQDTCPGWGGGTESIINGCLQAMWDEGPGGGHHDIMSGDYTHVACGFYTMDNGDIWANQNFK